MTVNVELALLILLLVNIVLSAVIIYLQSRENNNSRQEYVPNSGSNTNKSSGIDNLYKMIVKILDNQNEQNESIRLLINKTYKDSRQEETSKHEDVVKRDKTEPLTREAAYQQYVSSTPPIKDKMPHRGKIGQYEFTVTAYTFGQKGPSSVIICDYPNDRNGKMYVIAGSSFENQFANYFTVQNSLNQTPAVVIKTIKPASITKSSDGIWILSEYGKGALEAE